MLISSAFAQSAGGSGGAGGMDMLILLVPIILIMYFLIIRPQRQQMKKRQEMLNSVHRGDTVVTGGGIVGKVTKVYDESGELEVEISDGVKIRVLRSTLADIRRLEVADKKTAPVVKGNDNKKASKVVAKTPVKAQTDKPVKTDTDKKDDAEA